MSLKDLPRHVAVRFELQGDEELVGEPWEED